MHTSDQHRGGTNSSVEVEACSRRSFAASLSPLCLRASWVCHLWGLLLSIFIWSKVSDYCRRGQEFGIVLPLSNERLTGLTTKTQEGSLWYPAHNNECFPTPPVLLRVSECGAGRAPSHLRRNSVPSVISQPRASTSKGAAQGPQLVVAMQCSVRCLHLMPDFLFSSVGRG